MQYVDNNLLKHKKAVANIFQFKNISYKYLRFCFKKNNNNKSRKWSQLQTELPDLPSNDITINSK